MLSFPPFPVAAWTFSMLIDIEVLKVNFII